MPPRLALPDDIGASASLEVPSDLRYLRTLRLTTASLLTSWDGDVDLVEDLRVAVTEACTLLWDHHGRQGNVAVNYCLDGDLIRIDLQLTSTKPGRIADEAPPRSAATATADAIGESLITHLTDRFSYDADERRITLEAARSGSGSRLSRCVPGSPPE